MAADDSSLLTQFQNRMMFGTTQSEQPTQPPSLQQQQQQLPPLYSSSLSPPPHGIIPSGRHSQSRATTPPFLEQTLPRPHSHSRSLSQPSSFFHSLSDIAVSLQPPLGNPAVSNQTKADEGNRSSPAPMMPPPHLVDVSMSDDQDLPVVPANHHASSSASPSSSSALPPLSPMSSHHQAASRRHPDLLHPASSTRLAPPAPSRGHRRSRSETPLFRFDAGALGFQEPSSMAPSSIDQIFFASPTAVADADERRAAEREVPISQVPEISSSLRNETQWTVAAMDTSEHLGSAAMGSLIGEADVDLFSACFDIGGRNDAFGSLQNILRTGKTTSNTDDERIAWGADDRDKVSSEHGESFLDMASDSDKEDSDKEGDDGSSYNLKMMDGRLARHSRSVSVDDIVAPRSLQREAAGGGDDIASEQTSGVTEEPRRRQQTRHHHSLSMDGGSSSSNFNLLRNLSSELRLDGGDMKKTMTSDRLAELALVDPKRAKRILANRQSAARSKERKMRYISELERKVQTLQTEATTLSAQLTLMQRDSTGLFNENNELKLKLRSMEQQAQLREALNEALRGEVERLKLATVAGHGQMMLPANAMAQQQFYIHHQGASTASNGPHPSSAQQQVQQQHGHIPYPPPAPSTLHSQQHLQQR